MLAFSDKSVNTSILVLIGAVLFAFSMQGCYTFSDDLRGSIEGHVYLRNTEIPIANVEITIESERDSSVFTVYTDDDGYFAVDDVHFGVNRVTFSKKKYYNLTRYPDVNHESTFKLNAEMLVITPPRNIDISLLVNDRETGLPIPGTLIDIYFYVDNDNDDERDGYWDYYSTVYTDKDGMVVAHINSYYYDISRKQELETELRFAAPGYYEKYINFIIYFMSSEKYRLVELEPLD
ncbi:carboxypeptidase regulatory-like domain-containing protein [bacterium]|nr:carboxypeptidase regulatory-like domain-containing protein [bacterium]